MGNAEEGVRTMTTGKVTASPQVAAAPAAAPAAEMAAAPVVAVTAGAGVAGGAERGRVLMAAA